MKILYFVPDLKNPFWEEITQGVRDEAGLKHHSLKTFSADDQSDLQISQLQNFKTENPDAILISPIEIEKISDICHEIMESGLPIVAIDQHMVHTVHASVISGNLTGGILAAKFIGDHSNKAAIIHIKAPHGYENAALRRKSFINETRRQNNFIVKTIEGECDRRTSQSRMQEVLNEKLEFNAVFTENDVMALGVIDALKRINYTSWPIIVGFDGIPEAIESIKRNEMSATVQQQPQEMGQRAMELVEKIRLGHPYEEVANIPTRLLAMENLS